jgi:hypothetical protein
MKKLRQVQVASESLANMCQDIFIVDILSVKTFSTCSEYIPNIEMDSERQVQVAYI